MNKTRALRQHAAAVRQRKHYQQTRQAHLDFLTAAVMLYHECRGLGLGIQLSQPEYREFRKRLVDAVDCEQTYLALSKPRIVKVADLPPDPSSHTVDVAHACAGDKQRCFMPAKHFYEGAYYCGIHCPLSEEEDPVAAAEGKAVREMQSLYHGPERPQDWTVTAAFSPEMIERHKDCGPECPVKRATEKPEGQRVMDEMAAVRATMLPSCDHCKKPFVDGYRSEKGTTNYCNACLNILDSEGA